jgi:hypothetical protein
MRKSLSNLGILVGGVGSLLLASTAVAQTDISGAPSEWRGTLLEGSDALIATNKFGEPLFVQTGETVAARFEPSAITSEALADTFKKLCFDTGYDQARLASVARNSSLKLTKKEVSVRPLKSGVPFLATLWVSPEARVQIWPNDVSALKGRVTLSRWRKGMTSTPFNAGRTLAPACNISLMAKGFRNTESFVAAVTAFVGAPPTKAVLKPQWADGYWLVKTADKSETRIGFSFVDLDSQEQLLHISIARLPSKK